MTNVRQTNGGLARAAALSPQERSAIASHAARVRWSGEATAGPELKSLSRFVRRLEKHKAALAKRRDALREFVDEAEAILETVDRADEALQTAIDALSELV